MALLTNNFCPFLVKIALENAKYGHLAQSPLRLFVSLNKDAVFRLKFGRVKETAHFKNIKNCGQERI